LDRGGKRIITPQREVRNKERRKGKGVREKEDEDQKRSTPSVSRGKKSQNKKGKIYRFFGPLLR